jgi:hypothetical protein
VVEVRYRTGKGKGGMMHAVSLDAQEMAEALRELGFKNVKIEPSAVTFSPYEYVYVYLTDQEHEGHHLIFSDNYEWEDKPGILVGSYSHFEQEPTSDLITTKSIDEAVEWAREYLPDNIDTVHFDESTGDFKSWSRKDKVLRWYRSKTWPGRIAARRIDKQQKEKS